MSDPFDLDRFVAAQEPVIAQVRRELTEGRKRSHWMWYIFPQIAGLGHSATARHYAIGSVAEAEAYLAHSILGPRLIAATDLVNRVERRSVHEIFGSPDDLKFHSSMSLFALVDPGITSFHAALDKYFSGAKDQGTIAMVRCKSGTIGGA